MPDDNAVRQPTRSERVKNYCLALGSLTALILGAWANLKGEPKAERSWSQSRTGINGTRDQVNKLSEQVYRLQLRVISLQAAQEGYNAGRLWSENQRLAAELEGLRRGRRQPAKSGMALSDKINEERARAEKELKKAPPRLAPMPPMQQKLAE